MVEQQADALSGDGPALEDHLDAPLHEHVEQRGAVELLHAQERPLQRDRGCGCGGVDGMDASHHKRDSQGNVSNEREENGRFHRSAKYLEVARVEVFFNDDM